MGKTRDLFKKIRDNKALFVDKGLCQGCILSSCLFNLYAEYIMRNAGMEETQAGIKIARRLEKEMATHSSILAWKSPWTEEPGWLQSTGLHD